MKTEETQDSIKEGNQIKTAAIGAGAGAATGAAAGAGIGFAIGGVGIVACGTGVGVPVGLVCLAAAAVLGTGGAVVGGGTGYLLGEKTEVLQETFLTSTFSPYLTCPIMLIGVVLMLYSFYKIFREIRAARRQMKAYPGS